MAELGLSTAEFDRTIEDIKRKLDMVRLPAQTASRLQQGGMGGIMSQPTQDAFNKATKQSQRELEQHIASMAREQERLGKFIAQRTELLKKLENQQKSIVKGAQEEALLKEKIGRIEQNNAADRQRYKQQDDSLNKAMNTRGGFGGGGGTGGGGAGAGAGGDGLAVKSILKSLGIAFTAMAAGSAIYDQYTSLPLERNKALGAGTQSIIGDQLQNISQGNVVNQMAFMPERQRAFQMANEKLASTQKTDITSMAGTAGVRGVLSGMGIGNERHWSLLAGSVLDGVATVLKNSPKVQLLSAITGYDFAKKVSKLSEEYMTTYQSKLMEDYGKNYQEMVDAEVKKNPLKNLAANRLQERFQSDLQTQRMLGLGFEGFAGRGGFQERANLAGFTGDMGIQMAGQIQGSGGSTRGMVGNSVLGLQAQRGFDLTNAGSILGKLSGGAGSSQATDAVFRKILEEGVKAGLDKSDSVEELRRFSEMSADILSKTGASTGQDAERIMQGFSRFLGQGTPTIRELQGAKSAYDESQGFSAETGGRGGALQFAGLMKQPGMTKVGARGLAGLMEMPEQDLNANNPYIIAEAVKAGMSPEKLIENVVKAKREKALVEVGLDPAKMKMLQKAGIANKTLSEQELKALPDDQRRAYIESEEAATMRSGYEGPQKREAVARGFRTGGEPEGVRVKSDIEKMKEGLQPEDIVSSKLGKAPGTRPEDDVVKATGAAAQAMLENFRNFKTEITPASDALDAFTKKIILLGQVAAAASDKDRASVLKYAGEQLSTPATQPQAGKPQAK